ncbi:MAG: TolC family protein [Desulfurivibrionaceae bacterium]
MAKHIVCLICLLLIVAAPAFGAAPSPEAPLTLDEAIATALANNPAILRAVANLGSRQENSRAVRGESLPRLATSYSYASLSDSPYGIFNGEKVAVGARDNFAWDFTLTQPLFTGFALSAKKRMAELGIESGEVERQLAVLELTAQVRLAYYRIFRQKQMLKVRDETVAQLAAHVEDARHFYAQGLIPYNDLLKSQVALSNAEQARLQSRSDLEMAVARLNTLLRLPLDRPTEITELKPAPGTIPDFAPLVAEAEANRPEMQALQLALEKSMQQARLAKSAFFPQVDLEGRYARSGDDPGATTNDYANDHEASIGVKATWTLFDWGRTLARVNEQGHEHEALTQQLEQTRDDVRLQVKQGWLHLKVAQANIKTAESAQDQAEENFRITRLQYQKSLATSSDVLDARGLLSEAEGNSCNAAYGYLSAQAELERAVGHGVKQQ